MQDNGWLNWAHEGSEAGLAGQGLRVEALQVNLCQNLPPNMGITYQAHIQEIGWMNWAYDGQIAGTTAENKRLEAVHLKLINAPLGYHVTYRVYIEGSGWSSLRTDGEIAGTTGQGKRIEAIQINLIQPWSAFLESNKSFRQFTFQQHQKVGKTYPHKDKTEGKGA